MSLRAALRSSAHWSGRVATWPELPPPVEIERARQSVEAQAAGLSKADFPPFDLGELKRRLLGAAAARTLDQVRNRDWRYAAWAFWHEDDAVARDERIVAGFFERASAKRSPSFVKALINAYLAKFSPTSPTTVAISARLLELLRSGRWPALAVWLERHESLRLFSPSEGPTRAGAVLLNAASIEDGLAAMGLDASVSQAADHRFLAACYGASMYVAREAIGPNAQTSRKLVDRIIEWSRPVNAGARGIRYPVALAAMAEALLLPWQSRTPDAGVQRKIKEFLIGRVADPRLMPGAWATVHPSAVSILKRWLAGDTMAQFFTLLSRTADDIWEYRKRFWTAYYLRGAIEEAWFALGPLAAGAAHQVGLDSKGGQFASLTNGYTPDQSVLLMKIGKFVIAEWSHNGKCRIWQESDRNAPALYESNYWAARLRRTPIYERVHGGSAGGRWQTDIAAFLRSRTGISVDAYEWAE